MENLSVSRWNTSFHCKLLYTMWEGYVHCINPYNKQLHVKDLKGDTNLIKFEDIMNVKGL
ncbi:hypothetical protein ABES38_08695 [Bacillus gobiensis]|uniref:hypothetical protein n=1 Tax=Bacillus gobiensis TaxID=1441095 RepID=UPI003D19E39B